MKNILLLLIVLILTHCGGYKPIFYGKDINFYIEEVSNVNDDIISRKIIKKLKPYTIENNKNKINIKLNSSIEERIVSKDSKGDPLVFELKIQSKIELSSTNNKNEFNYTETFSFNNQSNKFELKQYKNNIENNLIDKIFEKLIFDLRSI